MAARRLPKRLESRISQIRVSSAKLIRSDDLAVEIENMYETQEGTLRAVRGPAPYLPDYATGGAPSSGDAAVVVTPVYGPTSGVFHARLKGGARDILLVHTGDQLWEFEGWRRAWKSLIGPTGSFSQITMSLEDSGRPQFPTQFVATPTGIIIIPHNRRAYFYDGVVILPLGYDRAPGAPVAMGPENSGISREDPPATGFPGMNDIRYAHDGLPNRASGMNKVFKRGRIGIAVHPTNYAVQYDGAGEAAIMGWLEPGLWRGKVRWIDRWGNLSPLSDSSEDITVERQPATGWTPALTTNFYVNADLVLKQFAWDGIVPGPEGTVGRILYRTKDLKQSGDPNYYELPLNATAAGNAFATMPDNVSRMYPDNIPDFWLVQSPDETVPVPQFRLAVLALGRLWIANIPGAEGLIRPSIPGLWGTFPTGQEFYPDPSGAAITGLHAVSRGFLAFTETSTYLIIPNDNGEGVRTMPLSTRVGCVAPSSIATIRNGLVIWLGRDGFYAYGGQSPEYIFEPLRAETRRFTRSRLPQAVAIFDERTNEYRCWLSTEGSKVNNQCYCYDGEGWRKRSDVSASGATVSNDHRKYVIVSGQVGASDGVWVQDVEQSLFSTTKEYVVETGWISSQDSRSRQSLKRIYIWMRESSRSEGATNPESVKLQVQVKRDWRDTVVATGTAEKRRESGEQPEFWGSATLGSEGAKWRGRRPYWTKVDVSVPSCEVFKIRMTSNEAWEFVGIQFSITPKDAGGANVPP